MIAYLVLLIAALTRFVPHAMHGVGLNFTAVGAGLLFLGARRGKLHPAVQAAIGMAVMAVSDVCLTTLVYGYPFHIKGYLVTWAWYAAVCLLGSALLQKVTFLRVAAGVLASATGFFLLSNFMVWAGSHHVLYAKSFGGLMACYAAGLPFYANDLASTTLAAGVLFGLPVLAARLVQSMRSTQHRNEPLA